MDFARCVITRIFTSRTFTTSTNKKYPSGWVLLGKFEQYFTIPKLFLFILFGDIVETQLTVMEFTL